MTMDKNELIIRNLTFIGPSKDPATIDFESGLNVVCGASDTGKSFLIEVIDFMLGGTKDLRDIPERVGYDQVRLAVETKGNVLHSFEKSTEGGNFTLYEGILRSELTPKESTTLKATHGHGKVDNLSGWLLDRTALFEKKIRKNKQGVTRSLSFRDLARLVVVTESEIIRQTSPFLTGQYTTGTSEYSTLKLLLTGVDDSAIVPNEEVSSRNVGVTAKIELVEQWITDLTDEIQDNALEESELLEQKTKLENSIETKKKSMSAFQSVLNESISARREIVDSREKIRDRLGEIDELLQRFDLLAKHYQVDIERLRAIEESGSLFVHHKKVPCPLCGAMPDDEHNDNECEGDVDSIVMAATAEIDKICKLENDLSVTIHELKIESEQLHTQLGEVEEAYKEVDQKIRDAISPDFEKSQLEYTQLMEKKGEISSGLELFSRIKKLQSQLAALNDVENEESKQETASTKLSKSVLNGFSQTVENILNSWNFPEVNSVYFDESVKDFVIAGKPRGSRGKGLRAITHAAVTIGLMEYCQSNSLPHPGFVVLDSPLLAYYKPEGDDDDLQGTDLKEKFYEYLVKNHSNSQIIIVENEHPPKTIENQINLTDFTKNPHQGRYGLFPIEH